MTDATHAARPSTGGEREPHRGRWHPWVFRVAAVGAWFLVLAVHGFVPGQSQIPLSALFGTGIIQCLHDQGVASLWTWCMSLGLPVGAPRLTGLPQVYLGWALSYLPGVDSWAAHQLTQAFFDTLGAVGGFFLLRRWGIARPTALVAVVAFATAANVLVLNGFPYTMEGFLLLPGFALAALVSLDAAAERRWLRAGSVAVLSSLLLVFTDGYAYFGGALLVGFLALGWTLRRRTSDLAGSLAGLTLWAVSLAGSAIAYVAYVPGDAYASDVPILYFGLLAVDVVTLLVPSAQFMWPRLLGVDPPVLEIWGIRDTPPTNYLGYLTIALAVVALVLAGRGERRAADGGVAVRGELVAVAVAGLIALVLSLGPTLKVGQVGEGLDASLLTLPTMWLYENAPGFSDLRATNRWLIVTRLALIFLAAAGVQALWSRWRRAGAIRLGAVILVAVLAVVETAPNPWSLVSQRSRSVDKVAELRDGVVAEADELLVQGETVLVLPSVNDFLAMYLVPMAGVQSYNVGGDKNYYLSVDSWPADVLAARDNYGDTGAGHLCLALDGEVDAIVLPYPSPYFAPLLVPEDVEQRAERERVARALADDPRFVAQRGDLMTVLRASGQECMAGAGLG